MDKQQFIKELDILLDKFFNLHQEASIQNNAGFIIPNCINYVQYHKNFIEKWTKEYE